MKVESGVTLLTHLSRSCRRFAPPSRGCWRFPSLPAGALHPPGSGLPLSTPANRRTRPLPRMRFEVSIGMPHVTDSSGLPGSWSVPTSRRAATDGRHPALRQSLEADDRTSISPGQNRGCAQSDPTAALRPCMQRECRNHSVSVSLLGRSTSHFLPYLRTFNFALSTFSEGLTCAHEH